jgi:flagellar motor switch protein FliG
MDPLSVAELLRNEHPQIVAAILVHLDSTRRPMC